MGLSDPSAALGAPTTRLRNVTMQPAKVSLAIAPGDEVVVTDDVAAQLVAASSAFAPSDSDRAARAMPGLIAHLTEPEPEPEPEPEVKPEPAKRPAKRKPASGN